MFIEHNFFIGFRDSDFKNNLKIKSMLSFLEDIAGIHSNQAGYGMLDIPKVRKSWMLLNWKVKFIRRPHYSEVLKIKTWSRKMDKIHAYRDFEVFDEAGNRVAIASSKWVLIDIDKASISKLDENLKNTYTLEDVSVFESEIEKLREPENYIRAQDVIITKDMIDVNEHVHNIDYIDFATQALPYEVMQTASNIEVMYKKEIKLNDNVQCFVCENNNEHIVALKSDEGKLLHALIRLS